METTRPKPFCFVLMPFDQNFSDIYTLGIKDACENAGAYCERVDEQIFQERILDRIFNQIAKADIVIADMTGKNPNVFYEVGYAHAIGKTTILLTQNSEDIPFDLKHFPHIIYNNKIVDLKSELTKRVKWFISNPGVKVEENLAIEIYSGHENLSSANVKIKSLAGATTPPNYNFEIPLTFYNNSSLTFYADDFKVGVIASKNVENFYNADHIGVTEVKLPDNRVLFMLPSFKTFFPSAYTNSMVDLIYSNPDVEEELIIRIFSSVGTRDYKLILSTSE